MPIDHAVTIPSSNNAPNPSGTLQFPDQPGPSPDNMLQCSYPCTIGGCMDTIELLWDGQYFSLPHRKANDPDVGAIEISYDPPINQ